MKKYLPPNIAKLEHFQNVETNRKGYLIGLAYDTFLRPDDDRAAHYFARELYYTMRFDSAIKAFHRHIDMNKWPTERSQSMIFLGECLMAQDKTQEAFSWFMRAFDIEPNRREPFMEIANYYYHLKKPDQTIAYVAAALQCKGANYYANHQPFYENIPHEMMYWALWQKGEIDASKQHFDICMSYQPFNSLYLHDYRFYYDLPEITFIANEKNVSEEYLNSIKELNYPQEKINFTFDGEKETGDWIVFTESNIIFEKDSIISAIKVATDNHKKFIAFSLDGKEPEKVGACHNYMIHVSLIDKLKDGPVNWENLKEVNQDMYCGRAIIKSIHNSK